MKISDESWLFYCGLFTDIIYCMVTEKIRLLGVEKLHIFSEKSIFKNILKQNFSIQNSESTKKKSMPFKVNAKMSD